MRKLGLTQVRSFVHVLSPGDQQSWFQTQSVWHLSNHCTFPFCIESMSLSHAVFLRSLAITHSSAYYIPEFPVSRRNSGKLDSLQNTCNYRYVIYFKTELLDFEWLFYWLFYNLGQINLLTPLIFRSGENMVPISQDCCELKECISLKALIIVPDTQ